MLWSIGQENSISECFYFNYSVFEGAEELLGGNAADVIILIQW